MKEETKSLLLIAGIIFIIAILLFVALFKFEKIDREQKNDACQEIGYKEHMANGKDDYCLIMDNVGIKVIMFQRGIGERTHHQDQSIFPNSFKVINKIANAPENPIPDEW